MRLKTSKNIKKRETKKLRKPIKTNADKFRLSLGVIKKIQNLEGKNIRVKEINDGIHTIGGIGQHLKLTNGATYNLYKNYNKMKSDARQTIKEDLMHEPGVFNPNVISEYIGANGIDIAAATDAVIKADGAEHFISSYDGKSYKTSDGQYLVKVNN